MKRLKVSLSTTPLFFVKIRATAEKFGYIKSTPVEKGHLKNKENST